MFAEDRGWLGRIAEAMRSGLTAEAAVQKVQDDTRARMSQVTDPYLRERLADLEDLANRLQRHLIGDRTGGARRLPDESILVARGMGPAELLDYDAPARAAGARGGLADGACRDRRARARPPWSAGSRSILTPRRAGRRVVVDGDNGSVCCGRATTCAKRSRRRSQAARAARAPVTRRCASCRR